METIKLVKKVVYGKVRLYPICDLAKSLLKIKKPGSKCFGKNDIKYLKKVVNVEIYIEEGNKLIKIE